MSSPAHTESRLFVGRAPEEAKVSGSSNFLLPHDERLEAASGETDETIGRMGTPWCSSTGVLLSEIEGSLQPEAEKVASETARLSIEGKPAGIPSGALKLGLGRRMNEPKDECPLVNLMPLEEAAGWGPCRAVWRA